MLVTARGRGTTGIWWGGAGVAAKHPTKHRTAPGAKTYVAPKISCAKLESKQRCSPRVVDRVSEITPLYCPVQRGPCLTELEKVVPTGISLGRP